MRKLELSPNFTLEDIRKIRDYDYEMTKDMTAEEISEYHQEGAERSRMRIAEARARYLAQNTQVQPLMAQD